MCVGGSSNKRADGVRRLVLELDKLIQLVLRKVQRSERL